MTMLLVILIVFGMGQTQTDSNFPAASKVKEVVTMSPTHAPNIIETSTPIPMKATDVPSFHSTVLLVSLVPGVGSLLMSEAARLLASDGFHCTLVLVGSKKDDVPSPSTGLEVFVVNSTLSMEGSSGHTETMMSTTDTLPQKDVDAHLSGCEALLQDKEVLTQLLAKPPRLLMFPGMLHDACVLPAFAGPETAGVVWSLGPVSEAWLGHTTGSVPFSEYLASALHSSRTPSSTFERLAVAWHWSTFLSDVEKRYWQPASALVKKHLDLTERSIVEVYRNVALMISSSHTLLEDPEPSLPMRVSVGCFHCRHAQSLPPEVQEWILAYRVGLIVISLPTSSHMETALIATARSLPQFAFLWIHQPHQSTQNSSSPSNLVRHPLCPGQDVLGHPRTRVLVSPCDSPSVLGAAYHGVAIVCVPTSLDHSLSAARVPLLGLGQVLTGEISAKILTAAILGVTGNTSFRHSGRHLGVMLRDEPESAAERLLFWAGHTSRHWGHGHEAAMLQARVRISTTPSLLAPLLHGFFLGLLVALVSLPTIYLACRFCRWSPRAMTEHHNKGKDE